MLGNSQVHNIVAVLFQKVVVPQLPNKQKVAVKLRQFEQNLRLSCGNLSKSCGKVAVYFIKNAVSCGQFCLKLRWVAAFK